MLKSLLRRPLQALITLAGVVALAACGGSPLPGFPPLPGLQVEPTAPARTPVVAIQPATEQPARLSGTLTYTNDFVFTYFVENAVALIDMYGFVTRDQEWEIPVESQVLGYFDLDPDSQRATYHLLLPALPPGNLVDVDNDGGADAGVQVFAVTWWPNLSGGPFSEGFDRSTGWPTYMASITIDRENKDEVTGGRLVVWAPDDAQQFPSGFGDDGLLFTADDPVAPLAAGYTVVDLDQRPFALIRDVEGVLDLYEPEDVAIKDFADLSYTEAVQQMFERIRREYAFNGIPGREPAWDDLYAELMPRVEDAERAGDARQFYLALRDFTLGFRDGHVGISGGPSGDASLGGGFGFAVRELDDGRFIVTFVLPNGPADDAGVRVGAELRTIDGRPIDDLIDTLPLLTGPVSSDVAARLERARLMLRAREGSSRTFGFAGDAPPEVTLRAVGEFESYVETLPYPDNDDALPVDFRTLDSGAGYIRINSNYDDLNLLVRLFTRALDTFERNGAPGIIIDLRANFGGSPLGLASYLIDEEIEIGQDEYYSDATGQFEPEGLPSTIEPADRTYSFRRMALLVDQGCFSACEFESYAFSLVPGMVVVGQYPTAGVYAEVARGQYEMPEGISLQFSTGRTVLPDGSVLLEGVGVVPTEKVPVDERTVLSDADVVLEAAERLVTGR
jgi:C-terminal processing protease CtpA/Prc